MPFPALSMLAQVSPEGGFPILKFFLNSGPVAKLVLGILLIFSLASWTVMIRKAVYFRRVRRENRRFLDIFRRSSRFSEIHSSTGRLGASPLVGLFQAGYLEIDSQVKASSEHAAEQGARYRVRSLGAVERSLRRAIAVELQVLARSTPILATTAAATPFIGLFGTVWGIMIAFNDIGSSGTASIVAVAPGIAEALINTAAGLVAAIPALVGYNHIAGRIRLMRNEMEDFALEFVNLTERNFT